MSSWSNSAMREAWIAAPRAESSDGLRATVEVAGALMGVVGGKMPARREAILGVCEVPPERMTYRMLMLYIFRGVVMSEVYLIDI